MTKDWSEEKKWYAEAGLSVTSRDMLAAISEIEQLRTTVKSLETQLRGSAEYGNTLHRMNEEKDREAEQLRREKEIYQVGCQELAEGHMSLDKANVKRKDSDGRNMGICERIERLELERNQLRQDKAELVWDLNWLASLISEIIPENWGDYTLSGFVYPGIKTKEVPKLLEMVAKHGGEQR